VILVITINQNRYRNTKYGVAAACDLFVAAFCIRDLAMIGRIGRLLESNGFSNMIGGMHTHIGRT
jgi:hypothetical protein